MERAGRTRASLRRATGRHQARRQGLPGSIPSRRRTTGSLIELVRGSANRPAISRPRAGSGAAGTGVVTRALAAVRPPRATRTPARLQRPPPEPGGEGVGERCSCPSRGRTFDAAVRQFRLLLLPTAPRRSRRRHRASSSARCPDLQCLDLIEREPVAETVTVLVGSPQAAAAMPHQASRARRASMLPGARSSVSRDHHAGGGSRR